MKTNNDSNFNHFEDAISHIDDDLLESALLMRQRLQENQKVKKAARILTLRKTATVAACAAVIATATVIAVVAAPAEESAETAMTTTENTGNIIVLPLPPDYLTLDEVYEIEPFSRYFPRSGLENLTLENCYRYTKERLKEEDLISQPVEIPIEYGEYLRTEFSDPQEPHPTLNKKLEIVVDKHSIYSQDSYAYSVYGNWPYTPYDTTDIESYERARHELYYYSYSEDVRKERAYKVFRPQDVSLEVIENLYHDFTQFESESVQSSVFGKYNFEIDILFDDDYILSYYYNGDNITPQMMYEIIKSAEYFAN